MKYISQDFCKHFKDVIFKTYLFLPRCSSLGCISSAGRSDNCAASDLALCPADGEVASRLLGVVAADPGVLPPAVGVRGDWGIVGRSGRPRPLFPSARDPSVSSLNASTTPEGESKINI